jgi:RNA polymerase subunit RPABC4/transcription elongation factor Spt4
MQMGMIIVMASRRSAIAPKIDEAVRYRVR